MDCTTAYTRAKILRSLYGTTENKIYVLEQCLEYLRMKQSLTEIGWEERHSLARGDGPYYNRVEVKYEHCTVHQYSDTAIWCVVMNSAPYDLLCDAPSQDEAEAFAVGYEMKLAAQATKGVSDEM